MADNKKKWQHIKVGCRYVSKYLLDAVVGGYRRDYAPFKPLEVFVEITYRCNLRCPTCFRWTSGEEDKGELGLEQWKLVIAKLSGWIGTYNMFFSGGEPFLKKELLEIVRYAAGLGIPSSIVSNGSLIDKRFAKDIVDSGLAALTLSLNSLDSKVHNDTRGTAGSYDEVMHAIENLRDRGNLKVNIAVTAMEENMHELVELAEFVKREKLDGINYQPVMPASSIPVPDKMGVRRKLPAGRFYDNLGKAKNGYEEIFGRLADMRNNGYLINNSKKHMDYMVKYLKNPGDAELLKYPCKIGPKNFLIDPYGNVKICALMEPIGNIITEDPGLIWRSKKAASQRRAIKACKEPCRLFTCNFKELDLFYQMKKMCKIG